METNFIEKLNKSRYNSILFLAIGFFLFYGSFMLSNLATNRSIIILSTLTGVIGTGLFAGSLIKLMKVSKQIKSDAKAKDALNDELFQLYTYKSYTWGFWTVLLTLVPLIAISSFYELPNKIVCELILFIAVLTVLISFLAYNRDTNC